MKTYSKLLRYVCCHDDEMGVPFNLFVLVVQKTIIRLVLRCTEQDLLTLIYAQWTCAMWHRYICNHMYPIYIYGHIWFDLESFQGLVSTIINTKPKWSCDLRNSDHDHFMSYPTRYCMKYRGQTKNRTRWLPSKFARVRDYYICLQLLPVNMLLDVIIKTVLFT